MYGICEQKVYEKPERLKEKYARVPDSVLFDRKLSLSARSVYGVLARYAFQGTTASIGQRKIARLLGIHLETVNLAIHELEERNHVAIAGKGKSRRYYHLLSPIFGQKQRAGYEEVIGSPSGGRRLASIRTADATPKGEGHPRQQCQPILSVTGPGPVGFGGWRPR